MTHEFVTTETRGNILMVTMNRPEVHNAVHSPMHHEMAQVWDDFAADQSLWIAVLTGAGEKAFTAGNDLKYTAKGGKGGLPPSGFAGLSSRFDLEKPIIAAVNGFAMGGGFETALSCDLIIAADSATFSLPEVKVGFIASASGIQRLSRTIHRRAAHEMMLTGRHVGAAEGLELGFVNAVVPKAELMEAAIAKANEIASVSPSSVRATKRVLNRMQVDEGLPESLAYSREVQLDLFKTADFREGVDAFVQKRKPEWKNC